MQDEIKNELSEIISDNVSADKQLLFSKILYLRQIEKFSHIPGMTLYHLARMFDFRFYGEGTTIDSGELLSTDTYYWIVKGKIEIRSGKNVIEEMNVYDVLGNFSFDVIEPETSTIHMAEDTICYILPGNKLSLLLFDYPEIAQAFLELNFEYV